MFSGIVETTGSVKSCRTDGELVRLTIERPKTFTDLQTGHSVCVDGVCLTLEEFDPQLMHFALGQETLKVTGWTLASVLGRVVNLERSLKLSDRIHGHLVTGHVDTTGSVCQLERSTGTQIVSVDFPKEFAPFLWSKGSVAINGVSLTINQCSPERFSVGLIPETLKRTNLGSLKFGDKVNLEIDNMARGLVHGTRLMQEL